MNDPMNFSRYEGQLFPLGQLVATPGARDLLEECDRHWNEFVARHATGDWGDLDISDKGRNEEALKKDGRLFSAYLLAPGKKIWIITEAGWHQTTVLLPSEY